MATTRSQRRSSPVEFVGNGEVRRDADGQVRRRTKEGTFGVRLPDGAAETTMSTSLTVPAPVRRMTKRQAWKLFDHTAHAYLHISGEEFLRRWDGGRYPHPDSDTRVMNVAMLIPLIR